MNSNKKNKIRPEELPLKNNFQVPEGYFEDFDLRLKEKLQSEIHPEERNTSNSWKLIRPQLMLAASIIAFAVISFTAVHFILNRNNLNDNSFDIAFEYIEDNIVGTDESDLLEIYSSVSENMEIEDTDEYSEAMIEFLVMENIDFEMIYNEL